MKAIAALTQIESWQKLLDLQDDVFAGIVPGAKIGLMLKEQFGSDNAQLLLWEITAAKVVAREDIFQGFQQSSIDLLFVAESEALMQFFGEQTRAFDLFSDLVRQGRMLLFYLKPRDEIADLGYEEFLEKVGVPFMGGCH